MPSATKQATKPSFTQSVMEFMGIMFLRSPLPLRLWIFSLVVVNMGGLFLFEGIEVKIVAGVFNVQAPIMVYLYQQHGFVRLLGLGHFLWPVMLPWIWFSRLPQIENNEGLSNWLTVVVVLNGISVVLDIMDVYRYFNGERKPTFFWDKTKAQ